MGGRGRYDVDFGDHAEAVVAAAEDLDMNTSVFVVGVVTEALRTGVAHRLARTAAENGTVTNRRRLRGRNVRKWETDGENWHSDEWTLVRQGKGGSHPKPGDGWYLHGPTMPDTGTLTSIHKTEAVRMADEIIDRHNATKEGL